MPHSAGQATCLSAYTSLRDQRCACIVLGPYTAYSGLVMLLMLLLQGVQYVNGNAHRCAGYKGEVGAEATGGHCRSTLRQTLRCEPRISDRALEQPPLHMTIIRPYENSVQGSVWGSGAAGIFCAALALLSHDPGIWQASCRPAKA